jgi:hypothetical protein
MIIYRILLHKLGVNFMSKIKKGDVFLFPIDDKYGLIQVIGKGILKRISNGKKLNSKDYGMIEKLNIWQIQNHEDTFLMNIYDVLKQNIV